MQKIKQEDGFALLITIVLVAFLVLILVAMSTLTRVETQVSDNSQQLAKAQQNAMMALNIAIGQLQKHAGPDRRLSARGELISTADKEKNLTGIWSATDADVATHDIWLVSGSEKSGATLANTLSDNVEDPDTGDVDKDKNELVNDDPAKNLVVLVGGGSLDVSASSWEKDRIVLVKQGIVAPAGSVPGLATAEPIGHYAWWVGDEGIKASLNLLDPTQTVDTSLNEIPSPHYDDTYYKLDVTTTRKNDWGGGETPSLEGILNRLRLNQQMLPQPQLQNLGLGINILEKNSDATGNSPRLTLPNINSKSALNFIRHEDTIDTNKRIKQLFHHVTPRAEAVLVDLSKDEQARLKRDLSDPSQRTDTNIGKYMALAPRAPATSATDILTYKISDKVYPVITEGRIRISFYKSGAVWKTAYRVDLEVWNPYAARLQVEDNELSLEISGLPDNITLTETGLTGPAVAATGSTNLKTNLGNPITLSCGAASWEPGEIRILNSFSSDVDKIVDSSVGNSVLDGQGITPVGSFNTNANFDVTDVSGTNDLQFILKINGQIVATYSPASDRQFNPNSTINRNYNATENDFALGYSFKLKDNIQAWTSNDSRINPVSGILLNCQPTVDEESQNYNKPLPERNATDAVHTGGFAPGDEFDVVKKIVLFDLPRQEMMSVGELRHALQFNTNWFDKFFMSTVPEVDPVNDFDSATTTGDWEIENLYKPVDSADYKPFPNRYVRLMKPLQQPMPDADALRETKKNTARYLLQTSAFNINSTSVDAWKSVLGARLAGWSYGNPASSTTLNHAFFRLPHGAQSLSNPPLGSTVIDIGNSERTVYTGGRELSDAEITALATQIVDQIKNNNGGRPFGYLQKFMNDNIIQNAIDATSINTNIAADRRGTPGYLTQMDVIAAIAPFITPRSDTFMVRSYGDVRNPVTGEVTSRAWCEATVQRIPDLAEDLNQTDITDNPAPLTLGKIVQPDFSSEFKLGRKFIITSFRWLSPDEI